MPYELELEETFEGDALDPGRWLPALDSRERSAAPYELRAGLLRLRIEAGQEPWCPELDGEDPGLVPPDGRLFRPLGSQVGQHPPGYPVQLMLSLYEIPPQDGDKTTGSYPKEFVVDYVRGYRLVP